MKNVIKKSAPFLLGIAIVGVVAFTANAQDKPKGKPWPADAAAAKVKMPATADAKAGKALWEQHCKKCHGATGKGDGNMAAKLPVSCGDFTSAETAKETDGGLFWKINEGRKESKMPSYKEKLTDSEKWNVVAYMRTFKK